MAEDKINSCPVCPTCKIEMIEIEDLEQGQVKHGFVCPICNHRIRKDEESLLMWICPKCGHGKAAAKQEACLKCNVLMKKVGAEDEIKPCPTCGAKMINAPYGGGYICMSCKRYFSWDYKEIIPGLNSLPNTHTICPVCNSYLKYHFAKFFVCNNPACRTYTLPQLLVFDAEVILDE